MRYLVLCMFAIFALSCQTDATKKEASDFFLRGNAKFKEKELQFMDKPPMLFLLS